MEKKTITEVLSSIQVKLKAPKNQRNTFGNYNYRNCEDILEALKPLLNEEGAYVMVSDEIVCIVDRFYVKATASIVNASGFISSTSFAREPLDRKGMDASQITGATSSYARKYALNGLFAIDDNKDPDATNDGKGDAVKKEEQTISEDDKKALGIISTKIGENELNGILIDLNIKSVSDIKDKETFNKVSRKAFEVLKEKKGVK